MNILLYSHDTYGLGHIRRTLALANSMRGKGRNVIIITGSPFAGKFEYPCGIDYIRIPGMTKFGNDLYRPTAITVTSKKTVNIRKNIILATAKTFQPSLFIVDKAPLGMAKEVLPTLRRTYESGRSTPCVRKSRQPRRGANMASIWPATNA